ncbi:hypothetical protein [Klebsiella pneumoniae]|uniref:HNH endonuclease n=1 Tax=Klebsiella pneumoniae TaxID=573 RepID=UPI003D6FCCA6
MARYDHHDEAWTIYYQINPQHRGTDVRDSYSLSGGVYGYGDGVIVVVRGRESRIVRSLRTEVTVGDKTIKALQIVRHRGQGKRPLVATFGGLSLAWKIDTVISDNPKQVFNGVRSELISSLLAQTCECCGSNDGPFEVYHIRKLSDLSQRGRKEKTRWLRIMASRHRKTIVVCRECHQNIHRTRPVRHREI